MTNFQFNFADKNLMRARNAKSVRVARSLNILLENIPLNRPFDHKKVLIVT